MNQFYCYFLTSGNQRTYIGYTNNLEKRIKQHNKIIKGGAKSTRSGKNWIFHTIVGNFENKERAQSFEFEWKHIKNNLGKWKKNKPKLENKMLRLIELLSSEKWEDINIINL